MCLEIRARGLRGAPNDILLRVAHRHPKRNDVTRVRGRFEATASAANSFSRYSSFQNALACKMVTDMVEVREEARQTDERRHAFVEANRPDIRGH